MSRTFACALIASLLGIAAPAAQDVRMIAGGPGTVTLTRSTVSNSEASAATNSAMGGGVFALGTVSATYSIVQGNVESDVVKTGRTICFVQSLIKADGVVIARANATFRVVPKKEPAN